MIIIKEVCHTPLYLQVYEQIKRMIVAGEVDSHSKMPSKRQLARELNISKNTIEIAYQQLLAEGYLKSKPRCGFFVEDIEKNIVPAKNSPFNIREEPLEQAEDMVDFSCRFQYGRLDATQFPFGLWNKLTSQCLQSGRESFLSYGDHQGVYGIRSEIAKYLYQARGVKCEPEQVIIGAGTQHCLGILCTIMREICNAIALEEPGYAGARSVFKNHGFKVFPIRLEEDGISVQQLSQSQADAVYVTPAHQFPTGVIMPIAARMRLVEWAQKCNGIIIEDDYCHLRYKTKPIPALQGICNTENVVYLSTFSKILAPSLRVSYMVLPLRLLDIYKSYYKDYAPAVPFLTQKTLEMFMKSGDWERHIRRTTQNYRKKHDLLLQTLFKYLGNRISIYGQNAGLHLMIKVNNGRHEQELIAQAAKLGVGVYPVSPHWAQQEDYGDDMVLLGFAAIAAADIEKGVELLYKAWLE